MVELVKKNFKLKLNDKGIGLIEAIIALAFAVIIIVSLFTLTNFNTRNSLLVTQNQEAINSGNLLLENLRGVKDLNFSNFSALISSCNSPNRCTMDSEGNIVAANINLDLVSPYSFFTVNKISDNEFEINIMTQWKIGNSTFSSPLSTVFTNWRAK